MLKKSADTGNGRLNRYRFLVGCAVLVVVYLLVVQRFYVWSPKILYGDDLDYFVSFLDGTCGTHLNTMFVVSCNERFRPLAFALISGLNYLFGTHTEGYFYVNAFVQVCIFAASYLISCRLSKSRLVALLLSAAIALSRFATYEVTQVLGPIESLSCLFGLLCVYFSIRADGGANARKDYVIAIICAALAILAHERYAVLSLWLCAVIVSAPALRQDIQWKIGLIVTALLIPACYVLYKNVALHAPFLIGTGGTHLSLNFGQILGFAQDAILSMVGINSGDEYLVGLKIDQNAGGAAVLAGVVCVTTVMIAAFGLAKNLTAVDKWKSLRWPIMLFFLAGLILGPGLLTIRLEQRWIFSPFILSVLALSFWIGQIRARWAALLALVLAVSSIALDHAIMEFYPRLFFTSSPRYAAMVQRDIVENRGLNLARGGEVAFIAERSQCHWSLLEGKFFRVYEGAARSVRCFDSMDSVVRAKLPDNVPLFTEQSGALVNVTKEYLSLRNSAGARVSYDFLEKFDAGVINSDRVVDTPSRKGVMLIPWKSIIGPCRTLTILSGFAYKFPDVPIAHDEHLRFGVTMVFRAPQSARAVVKAELEDGDVVTLFSKDLSIPDHEDTRNFIPVDLDLGAFAGKKVSIIFSIESPGGDSTSHWVAFSEPRIQVQS